MSLEPLLRLPSANDTGYAGLCATPDPDRFLVSYYSQHTTGQTFRTRLPGSQVFLAAVTAPQRGAQHLPWSPY